MICKFYENRFINYSNLNVSFFRSIFKNTRKNLFDKVESLSVAEVKKFKVSSLITRTTNDITQLQMLFAMGTIFVIKSPVIKTFSPPSLPHVPLTVSLNPTLVDKGTPMF